MKRERDEHTDTSGPYTCCGGPWFTFPYSITTKTIVDFVYALRARFGKGYEFRIEPITEGGIQMMSWPGKEHARAYKTMRFHIQRGKWPFIEDNTFGQWENSPPILLWPLPPKEAKKKQKPVDGELYFKAFSGAPCWTPDEVSLVVSATESVGFKCPKSHIPKKTNLTAYGDLGALYPEDL